MQGWRTLGGEGDFWAPAMLVHLEDDWLDVDAQLLVASVEFRFGADEGKIVQMDLVRPETFDMADYPAGGRGLWT